MKKKRRKNLSWQFMRKKAINNFLFSQYEITFNSLSQAMRKANEAISEFEKAAKLCSEIVKKLNIKKEI